MPKARRRAAAGPTLREPVAVVDIGSNSGRVMVFRPEAGGHLHVLAGSRAALRLAWNRPVLWPIAVIALLLAAVTIPALAAYRRRERMGGKSGSEPEKGRIGL